MIGAAIWVGSKWLLAFPKALVTPTLLSQQPFFHGAAEAPTLLNHTYSSQSPKEKHTYSTKEKHLKKKKQIQNKEKQIHLKKNTPTLLNRSFPHIPFAPSPLALSCSQKVLQDLGSDHQPILQAVVFSPVFRPNKPSPSFNSQKARWDDFTFYFDSHSFSAEEYSSLSLSSPAALFTSLTLNVVKFSIPFRRIKRCSKAWWSAEAEEAIIERRKAFAAAHRSDKIDRLTSPLPDVLRLSSPKLRNGRQLALFSRLNLTLNLCTLPFVLSLAHLPPLLTSQTVPLPGSVFDLFQCSVLLKEFIVSEIYLKPLPP